MKKLFLYVACLILIMLSVFSVSAGEVVSFECEDTSCDNNRLVTVNVRAESDKKLSAATFEFTFDGEMFEYRKVKSDDSDTIVKANETDNTVLVEYLNTYGKDISDGEVIFTVTLKAINSGTGYLDFTVSNCVDGDVNYIDVGDCVSAKITVNGSGSNSDSGSDSGSGSSSGRSKSSGSSSSGSRSSSGSSGKSSRNSDSEDEETTYGSTYDEIGVLNPVDDTTKPLIAGIIIGAVIVAVLVLVFLAGKRSAVRKNNSNNDECNNDEGGASD